ncbi:hypothetical protein CF086_16875 [Clostridium botulinum]|uniref:hypothetical protein n=1 Tax=Clostridium botulinum TaxID=1491 RepID=UPI000774B87C|nr:hypothetical protein [Clostridium botulinum]MBN3351969.1 hypothetical protein [Clostridium botulinum]
MAKQSINEKIITTHKLDIEGTLNVDNLQEGMLIAELEDEGEKDLKDLISKFNSKFVKISITDKVEEIPEE